MGGITKRWRSKFQNWTLGRTGREEIADKPRKRKVHPSLGFCGATMGDREGIGVWERCDPTIPVAKIENWCDQ